MKERCNEGAHGADDPFPSFSRVWTRSFWKTSLDWATLRCRGTVFRKQWVEFEPKVGQPVSRPGYGSRPQKVDNHHRPEGCPGSFCSSRSSELPPVPSNQRRPCKLNKVGVFRLFNEVQQALNRVRHHYALSSSNLVLDISHVLFFLYFFMLSYSITLS